MTTVEIWGGVECTVNRVGDSYFDQLVRSGHDHRPEDLERFAALGIRALRYPLVWERLAPRSVDDITWQWADERLQRLRELDIAPIAGLVHHGSGPAYTSLVDDSFPTLLATYARAVAERYPWIEAWTPVNEPLTTARFSGLYGHWYPHGRSDAVYVRALVNQLRGVVLAMREVRAVNPRARLVQTEDAGQSFGTPRLRHQVEHEAQRRWLTFDLLTGRVDRRHPLRPFLRKAGATDEELEFFVESACVPDVLGLNYYLTSDRWLDDRLELYPPSSHGGNGSLRYADVEAIRARADGIAGHEQCLVDAWERYRLPVAITEAHLGCTREEQMRWLLEAWRGAERARDRGADVRAVTAWALLGSHDWDSLVTRGAGHYEPGVFDVRSSPPRPTALSGIIRQLANAETPGHPVLNSPGWWVRPERLTFPSAAACAASSSCAGDAPPILIVGARGTLGRAFQRVCAARGLQAHVVTRAELEMADPTRVDAAIRHVSPWAVINAGGFVRVDAADSEFDACWRDNVTGPVNLAAACRRRGLPLVTFSSDLVFDGSVQRPYEEMDRPAPLNAYGASKAEAERRVLDLLPHALVIRTSAFFGPWDDSNFATLLVRSTLEGRPFAAPDDYVVSPTYVPDLVNATLDLLIDGEHGIWHLANEGAVTWYEFGCAVARRLSEEPMVQRCACRDLWQPAVRPSYSVLGSARGRIMRPLDAALDAYAMAFADASAEAAQG